MTTVYDFTAKSLDGQDVALRDFKGQALLIVNTASACGFTPQYRDLESLYRAYNSRGFSVLGFPCNQFNGQEPGDAEQIADFCVNTYNVTFPMFDKIEVNGENAHPLYKHLKDEKPGILGLKGIKWNFTKFIIDRYGKVVSRHAPTTSPSAMKDEIESLL